MRKIGYTSAVAAAMMILGTSVAALGAEDCGVKPTPPAMPDGSTIKADEMNKLGKAVEAYVNGFDKWHQCMATMVNASSDEYNATVAAYQKEMAAFKAKK